MVHNIVSTLLTQYFKPYLDRFGIPVLSTPSWNGWVVNIRKPINRFPGSGTLCSNHVYLYRDQTWFSVSGFDTSLGAYRPVYVNASKSMLLHKTFCRWRKFFEKFFFLVPIMAEKGTLDANIVKTPLPGQRQMSSRRHEITFASVQVTDDDVLFYDGPQ